jgi:heme-degrading monooxygenase HmoA
MTECPAHPDPAARLDRRQLLQLLATAAPALFVSGLAPESLGASAAPTPSGALREVPSPEQEARMYVQFVKLSSTLSDEDVQRVMRERLPQFQAIPGLVQKYYAREQDGGSWAGIYIWDSKQSMQAFLQSELRRTIPEAYAVSEPPRVEFYEVLFPLRTD